MNAPRDPIQISDVQTEPDSGLSVSNQDTVSIKLSRPIDGMQSRNARDDFTPMRYHFNLLGAAAILEGWRAAEKGIA
jgi:hypothetical protein